MFANMIISIITILLLFAFTNAVDNSCCSGINVIMDNGTCFDGSALKMNATCDFRVVLSTNQYALSENGSLIELAGMDEFVSQDRFCLGTFDSSGEKISVVCMNALEQQENFYVARVICSIISIIFLLLTITVYILVPKLRDLQGKCILNSMVGLIAAFTSLSIVQMNNSFQRGPCLFWAFTVYFTFLVAFFWLNVVAINMWRKTVIPSSFNKKDNFWYALYLVYGYGGPTIFIISTITAHNVEGSHIKPGFGDGICFLNAPLPLWTYFYGPIASLLIINFFLFIWSSVILWSNFEDQSSKTRNLKYKCLLTLKLSLIMGVPWLFEVLSFTLEGVHEYLDYLWSITDYLNSLQGVLIFLVLVLFRKKALRGLASNPIIGSKFPRSWQRLEDVESSVEEEVLSSESK